MIDGYDENRYLNCKKGLEREISRIMLHDLGHEIHNLDASNELLCQMIESSQPHSEIVASCENCRTSVEDTQEWTRSMHGFIIVGGPITILHVLHDLGHRLHRIEGFNEALSRAIEKGELNSDIVTNCERSKTAIRHAQQLTRSFFQFVNCGIKSNPDLKLDVLEPVINLKGRKFLRGSLQFPVNTRILLDGEYDLPAMRLGFLIIFSTIAREENFGFEQMQISVKSARNVENEIVISVEGMDLEFIERLFANFSTQNEHEPSHSSLQAARFLIEGNGGAFSIVNTKAESNPALEIRFPSPPKEG